MQVANNFKIVLASSLLLTLVSCGNDKSSSHKAPAESIDPIVQSYDWKILNGRGFPARSLVEVNGEPVLDECHDKQIYSINRRSSPQSLTLMNWNSPQGMTVAEVKIFDRGHDCDQVTPVVNETVRMEINKSGAVAEVILSI